MKVGSVNQMQELQSQGIKQQNSTLGAQSVTNFADIIALLMQMNGESTPDSLPDILDNLSDPNLNSEMEETSDDSDFPFSEEIPLLFSLGGMDAVVQQLQQTVLPDELTELISQNVKSSSMNPSNLSASIASQATLPLTITTEDSPQIDFSDILEVQYQPGSSHGFGDRNAVPISESNATYEALGEAISSIRSVKESLHKDSPEFSELLKAIDSTAVQGTIDRPTPSTPLHPTEKAVQIPREEQILTQLETGIRENLHLGKREFTMKLNPESLGEITVRLTEDADKMTLHIVTASHKTAGLINDELSALRQVMAPLQVEVHEAKTVPVDPSASSQSGTFSSMEQNFTGGHFSGGAFSQQQQQHNNQYASASYQETLEDATVLTPNSFDDDNLDTYI